VNFRASHQHEAMKLRPNLLENLELADIVRGSQEDFEIMFNMSDADKVYRSEIAFYTKKFICTRAAEPIELRADGGLSKQYPVQPTETVSTIGAGDNFNAGLIYGLIKENITSYDMERGLTEQQWDSIIGYGQLFSAEACRSLYNYVPVDFKEKLK